MPNPATLAAALKPFALLCELHDDPSLADADGMIFPGSKACVRMGDLRAVRRVWAEAERQVAAERAAHAASDAKIRAQIKPECPRCGAALDSYMTWDVRSGVKASVTYACGRVFVDETLSEAVGHSEAGDQHG